MPRIYTEIRIAHKTETDKKQFEKILQENIKESGCTDKADYIRFMVKMQNSIDKSKRKSE
jgi:hypothetical protein